VGGYTVWALRFIESNVKGGVKCDCEIERHLVTEEKKPDKLNSAVRRTIYDTRCCQYRCIINDLFIENTGTICDCVHVLLHPLISQIAILQ